MKDIIRQNSASLIIFARHPEKGKVKTRLAKTLGAEKATEFYRLCAEHLFQETKKLPPEIKRYIYFDGIENENRLQAWAGADFNYAVQADGSLGRRLENAFSIQFSQGAGKVLIVASDVPDISSSIMVRAFRSLDNYEIVIGPCHDGGYYMIGMKQMHRDIFNGIPWSTSQVYTRTLTNINKLGISLCQLRSLYDIDKEEDLNQWSKTIITPESNPWGNLLKGRDIIDHKG